jgi:Cytochrome P460
MSDRTKVATRLDALACFTAPIGRQEGTDMILRLSILVLAFLILAGYEEVKPQPQNNYGGFDLVDKAGNIRRPNDFRDRYQALGTYMVLDPKGNQMHVTYASPGTAESYRKTGKFPDGTVLVKEIFGTDHAQMTTGDAHWASGTKVWFVMIKDEKGRYSNSPLWGDGWGWALFKSDAPDKQVATDYKKDCLGCHIPARGTDWVYVQGYPALASK